MIWFAVTTVIALALVALAMTEEYKTFRTGGYRDRFITVDGVMTTIFATMAILIVTSMIGYGLAGLSGTIRHMDASTSSYKFPIVAIADGSETRGSFFLFSGSMDEQPRYFFYRQDTPDGPIRQGNVAVHKTDVYEDTEQSGYIKVIRYGYSCDWLGCDWSGHKRYELHVPKGSVVRQFNFDLE